MKLRLLLAAAVLLVVLPASNAAAGVEVGKVRGQISIECAAYGPGVATIDAREALGAPGDAWYRPASGTLTLTYAGVVRHFVIDYAVVQGSQAILAGADQDGARLSFRIIDGKPDRFGMGTGMSVLSWTVTGGNVVAKDR